MTTPSPRQDSPAALGHFCVQTNPKFRSLTSAARLCSGFAATALLVASLALSLVPSRAQADVSVSSSNDPSISIDAGIAAQELPSGQSRGLDTSLFRAFFRPLTPEPAPRLPDVEYTRAFIDALPVATGDAQWECLTQALYFEARGEKVKGQFAVAEVILNRVDSSAFPTTVCKVINQGTGKKYQCQFTYTCDGIAEKVHEKAAWERVGKIAKLMLEGAPRVLTDGATHYHTRAVSPSWSRKFAQTTAIGTHLFYRMPQA